MNIQHRGQFFTLGHNIIYVCFMYFYSDSIDMIQFVLAFFLLGMKIKSFLKLPYNAGFVA